MPVSRIKVKNRHLKKKAKKPLAFYKPATKFAGAVLIAGTDDHSRAFAPTNKPNGSGCNQFDRSFY